MPQICQTSSVIGLSESAKGKNNLCNRMAQFGFDAACFVKERIGLDNFTSLEPKIVIVHKKSRQAEASSGPQETKSGWLKKLEMSLKKICPVFASQTEKKLMQKALGLTDWNRKNAAELPNISRITMLNKKKAYDIV